MSEIKLKIYIAARFSRRHEANELAQKLKAHGHKITSRWVLPDSDHVTPVGMSAQAADAERERFAIEDCDDVKACNWCISLMEEPRSNGRGGRHVEFGYALALGKRMTIIGPRETVFHHLPQVQHFETVAQFAAEIESLDRMLGCDWQGHAFGATYEDATCIDGYLWDLDSCDEPGGTLSIGGDIPCPQCNEAARDAYFADGDEE